MTTTSRGREILGVKEKYVCLSSAEALDYGTPSI